ncbi:ATP-binding cassette domain-containing protein [Corynebacterium sp.]|uniref:ATP-binding cassette domain-containing protein n=1 Tax=Corynebacterium sp. TaxID=1720 RepID=UPI0026477F7A|nr:ATP-binding cassette domain-containing protein [Corynebacterium sp.]MDN6281912.1 ATP-binding cassette domain-containing protein [Corynebacterium sp.]MDN6352178.1 ATP-binding cassette domain-containing protein [Corynebacterium sp.]MDN6375609.1 ATP-binding cassette domain-containing protein [Corynebacterium sp.]MDN6396526.1 ATP-binding cassette domain-containing protein [Corynebacterium sp.]
MKSFGEQVVLDDLSFSVEEGTVLGVLGPNGSGKTTAVKAVTGLYRVDSGQAKILGRSVIQDAEEIKQFTGFSGQYAAVDEDLSTAENLVLVGRLYGHSKMDARRRADQLIDAFDMGPYARKRVGQHSGGMRRRVDLACALVGDPRVLVLDEPTTGLDPTSRQGLWGMIEELVDGGMTLLLTTQYLEEADVLADQVLVIDEGRQVALGTPEELKGHLGGDRVQVELSSPKQDEGTAVRSIQTLLHDSEVNITASDGHLIFRTPDAARKLVPCVNALTEAGVAIEGISVQQPTLDDVFFALTQDSNTSVTNLPATERSE